MVNFYKKYINVIVVSILFLLLCKTCQSCHRANQIEWNQNQYELREDSLKNIIYNFSLTNEALNDTFILHTFASV